MVTKEQDLIDAVNSALIKDESRRVREQEGDELRLRISRLTPEEMELMGLLASGKSNKEIAYEQKISLRTVESRRATSLKKLGVDSLAPAVGLLTEWRLRGADKH